MKAAGGTRRPAQLRLREWSERNRREVTASLTARVSRTLAAWAAAHLVPWKHKGHEGPCPPECTPWEGHEPSEDNYWQPRKSAVTPGGDVGQKCSRRWGMPLLGSLGLALELESDSALLKLGLAH